MQSETNVGYVHVWNPAAIEKPRLVSDYSAVDRQLTIDLKKQVNYCSCYLKSQLDCQTVHW